MGNRVFPDWPTPSSRATDMSCLRAWTYQSEFHFLIAYETGCFDCVWTLRRNEQHRRRRRRDRCPKPYNDKNLGDLENTRIDDASTRCFRGPLR